MNLNILYMLCFLTCFSFGCDSSEEKQASSAPKISITSPHEGYIYIDGKYKGSKTPKELFLSNGTHVIGVAMNETRTYLRKEIEVTDEVTAVNLTDLDKPEPKIWKALWIGVETVTHDACTSTYSKEDLDQAYNYFCWCIEEHFEKFSYNTTKWEVVREDYSEPLSLDLANNGLLINPSTIASLKLEIKPGDYDAIFCFYREKEGDCHMEGNFFGLAWLDPLSHNFKAGFVIVKFDDYKSGSVKERLQWYKDNDPGVWCHEWLHTVGEGFYQDLGCELPEKNTQGLVIHSAETYKYTYPWLGWYEDIISGRVKHLNRPMEYVGIGPETFLKYNVRDIAVQ